MDPVSLTTAVVTFIGACNALASTIQKLHGLRKAPKELQDLDNEISALKSCIVGIGQLVKSHSGDGNDWISQLSIGLSIDNACRKIKETQRYLEQSLLDTTTGRKIRPSAWLKWLPEFQRLRQELRDIRSELGTCICLYNAYVCPIRSLDLRRSRHGTNIARCVKLRFRNAARVIPGTDRKLTL